MSEKRDSVPTKFVDLHIKEDGSRELTFECGSPYQKNDSLIPSSELAIRVSSKRWSIPKIICNSYDQKTGKCIRLKLSEPDLQDCPWAKSL